MTSRQAASSSWRRAQRTFWLLVLIAVLAAGVLSSAASARPGPLIALRVAVSGIAVIVSVALAGRVFLHLQRARRDTRSAPGAKKLASRPAHTRRSA